MRAAKPTRGPDPALGAVKVGGMTRGAFVLRGTLAVGGAYGGSMIAPFVGGALAQPGAAPRDLNILNFALTLEQLEATFYEEALTEVGGLSGEARTLTEELRDNEAEHVDALTTLIEDLGGDPVDGLEFDFRDAFSDEQSYLELAQDLEDTGVSAYNGAAPMISDKDILATAGEIVQVEGRHAALVRLLRGEEPAPNAFDETFDMNDAMDLIDPYIIS